MTMQSTQRTRVNARLDVACAAKLAEVERATGLSVSEIIKKGIDLVHRELDKPRRTPYEIMCDVGFIGSGEGPGDLSESYKEELTRLLEEKHGLR